jgi:hypothetical protein
MSAAGTTSTGARLDEIEAIQLESITFELRVDCERSTSIDQMHVVSAAELAQAGRNGFKRWRERKRPVNVQLDRIESRWAPFRA